MRLRYIKYATNIWWPDHDQYRIIMQAHHDEVYDRITGLTLQQLFNGISDIDFSRYYKKKLNWIKIYIINPLADDYVPCDLKEAPISLKNILAAHAKVRTIIFNNSMNEVLCEYFTLRNEDSHEVRKYWFDYKVLYSKGCVSPHIGDVYGTTKAITSGFKDADDNLVAINESANLVVTDISNGRYIMHWPLIDGNKDISIGYDFVPAKDITVKRYYNNGDMHEYRHKAGDIINMTDFGFCCNHIPLGLLKKIDDK